MNNAPANGLQIFRFSTASCPPAERVAAWREVFGRAIAKIDIAPRSPQDFHASAEITRSPNFGLVHASASAARHVLADDHVAGGRSVSFMIAMASPWSASQLGRNVDLKPGDGVLMNNGDCGAILLASECRYVTFRISRSALEPLIPDLDALFGCRIPAANQALQVLVGYLGLARSGLIVATRELATTYAAHICDLLALALATRSGTELGDVRDHSSARLCVIKEDIRGNLHQPDVSVHSIAARHKVSVRYLQKLFEESGCTFTQFVTEERLAAAYAAFNVPSNVRISTIAYNLGFSDLSNFNRLFRHRFGCSPSDVRRIAGVPVKPDCGRQRHAVPTSERPAVAG